jgi:hypothetical protein
MVLIIVAAAARGVCQAMHVDPHAHAMMIATAINILAAELGLLPLLFTRNSSQLAVVQAGLVATMVQMFMAVILSAIALYAMAAGQPFVFWVIPLYWVGLAILVSGLVRAIRRTNPPLQTKATNP